MDRETVKTSNSSLHSPKNPFFYAPERHSNEQITTRIKGEYETMTLFLKASKMTGTSVLEGIARVQEHENRKEAE